MDPNSIKDSLSAIWEIVKARSAAELTVKDLSEVFQYHLHWVNSMQADPGDFLSLFTIEVLETFNQKGGETLQVLRKDIERAAGRALYRIRRLLRDRVRESTLPDVPDEFDSPEKQLVKKELLEALKLAIQELDSAELLVFEQETRGIGSAHVIASSLGVSIATAYRLRHSLHAKLRKALKKFDTTKPTP